MDETAQRLYDGLKRNGGTPKKREVEEVIAEGIEKGLAPEVVADLVTRSVALGDSFVAAFRRRLPLRALATAEERRRQRQAALGLTIHEQRDRHERQEREEIEKKLAADAAAHPRGQHGQ